MPAPEPHYPGLDEPVQFRLASGEIIQVVLSEGPLGVGGYRLKIASNRGLIAALPSAGNSLEIGTLASLQQEQQRVAETMREREDKKPRAPTPRGG